MSATQNKTNTVVSKKTTEKKYQNEEWLRDQYREKKRTMAEIAEICGCSRSTIQYWIEKFVLQRPESATFTENGKGYKQWRCREGDTIQSVTVHRLLATLKVGKLDELDGKVVHHKSHSPYDNRLENLELMEPAEHTKHHKGDGEPVLPSETL